MEHRFPLTVAEEVQRELDSRFELVRDPVLAGASRGKAGQSIFLVFRLNELKIDPRGRNSILCILFGEMEQ